MNRDRAQGCRGGGPTDLRSLAVLGIAVLALVAGSLLAPSGALAQPVSWIQPIDATLLDRDSEPEELTDVDGIAYFTASDREHGRSLWRSDGSREGTRLVFATPPDGLPLVRDLTAVDGTLFFTRGFQAQAGQGLELWRSDGTEAGTELVRDFAQGGGGALSELTAFDGSLYFTADDGTNGVELWRSDGTEAGTAMVRNIAPDGGSAPEALTPAAGSLFFTVSHGGPTATELWRSDGTEAGTELVRDFGQQGGRLASAPEPTAFDGSLYFTADDGTNGAELWRSDGTQAGTTLVSNINPGAGSRPGSLVATASHLLFSADDGVHGRELWRSDGTDAGTRLVAELTSDGGTAFREMTAANELAFFLAAPAGRDVSVHELWRSNGTPEGTHRVARFRSPRPLGITAVGDHIYFPASAGRHGRELWRSDGTSSGTHLVKDIYPGSSSNPAILTEVAGGLFFRAEDRRHGIELWRSDGTEGGTRLVENIRRSRLRALPAGLNLRRARIARGRLAVRGQVSPLAAGERVRMRLRTRSGRVVFGSTVRESGGFGIDLPLRGSLRDERVGVLDLRYGGNHVLQRERSSLRAGAGSVGLRLATPRIAGPRLRIHGRVDPRIGGRAVVEVMFMRANGTVARGARSVRVNRRGRFQLTGTSRATRTWLAWTTVTHRGGGGAHGQAQITWIGQGP